MSTKCQFNVLINDRKSMYSHRFCQNTAKFEVVLSYGTKHFCTLHKNIMSKEKYFISSKLLNVL